MNPLSHDDINAILHQIDDSPYDTLTLQTERFTLQLQRTADGKGWTQEQLTAQHSPALTLQRSAALGGKPALEEPAPSQTGLLDLRAPMVGTYYEAPKPGADPYVQIGSQVAPDTAIGIIEVMKLMSTVPAGLSGTVTEILVQDAQVVEAGQLLMRVKPRAS